MVLCFFNVYFRVSFLPSSSSSPASPFISVHLHKKLRGRRCSLSPRYWVLPMTRLRNPLNLPYSLKPPIKPPVKPPVDRKRLVTNPQLRQEPATAVGRHLRANPPGDSNVDDVKAAFAAALMRTAQLVIPPQETKKTRVRLEWRRPNGS